MEPTVREAKQFDAREISHIARESWHGAYDEILGTETVDEVVDEWYDFERLEDSIANAAAREDAIFLVGEAPEGYGTELVGFAHAGPDTEDDDVAELIRIYVRPAAWGEGAGRTLLEAVDDALGPHYGRLRLSVLADNEVGLRFYETTGFERVDSRDSDLGEGLEEYVYEKPI